VASGHPNAYPEVTGYLVPTLLGYGQVDLARRLVEWLLCAQRDNGAFTDPDVGADCIFDTGQVLRGLLAARDLVLEANPAARRAVEYLQSQMLEGGSKGFRLSYADGEIPESVELYVLPPLVEAAKIFHLPELAAAATRCFEYYREAKDVLRFDGLTHFLAYELEALIDLGHADLARPTLDRLRALQTKDGAVRGTGSAEWICTPGLAQIAVCWYKTGQWAAADRAVAWLEAHQGDGGGFLGSYGPGACYFPEKEISWAAKYYLDANTLRVAAFFERHSADFPAEVQLTDGRTQAILRYVKPRDRVAEIGCGKGRFLQALRLAQPGLDCTGIDPSGSLLTALPAGITGLLGRIEAIPAGDNAFDVVFAVEAVEHSANLERAVAEMSRVCTPGGWIIIVDKHQAAWGRLECPPWEQWPEATYLKRLLQAQCDDVTVEPVAYDDRPANDNLLLAWVGRKRSRLTGREWHTAIISHNTKSEVIGAVRFNRFSPWGRAMMLETKRGDHVLEIGSGTAQISLQLAQGGRHVTCFDIEQSNLEFARGCANELGLQIATMRGDATGRLPFENGQFDCVWSSGLLEHFFLDERRTMLREWARVCRGAFIHLVPNASCVPYRLGKRAQEVAGAWPYGLEMPLLSLRADYEAAGIRFVREFTVGAKHALGFMSTELESLHRDMAQAFDPIHESILADWNQGYLLLSIGDTSSGSQVRSEVTAQGTPAPRLG
jgi:malonyl-CoA O-methyltransferase